MVGMQVQERTKQPAGHRGCSPKSVSDHGQRASVCVENPTSSDFPEDLAFAVLNACCLNFHVLQKATGGRTVTVAEGGSMLSTVTLLSWPG